MERVQGAVKRLALPIIAGTLVATACSNGGPAASSAHTPPASPTASPSLTASPTASPTPAETTALQVWFTRNGKLFPTERSVPETKAVGTAALAQLALGLSPDESDAGLTTAIPPGLEFGNLAIADGVATVSVSDPSIADSRLAVGQVVYTLTQFASVQRVQLEASGAPLPGFDEPQKRKDYGRLLPAIVVETPSVGDTVSSPVTVAGTADVFEATVSIRILDADGNKLADTFTTATCGTGCRGDYSKDVSFDFTDEQSGTVMVFESSAENGRPINVVRIPVTLAP